jgi:segregation and condensation protein A
MGEEETGLINITNVPSIQKVKQEQIHGLLFGDTVSWQAIIYDLINSEQLDPWDVDISLLANKYLDKIKEIEEANFFVSSKVMLAAALLLRIKSEILLDEYIPTMDEILFGKKEEKTARIQERIELDEEIPTLMPRTPLPRFRKVSLDELMAALGKAISTETRRIRKVVLTRQQEFETAMALPKHRINIQDEIKQVHGRLKEIFSNRKEKLAFSDFVDNNRESKVATFIPLLHLDTQHKVWLEQEKHFDEIWILLKHLYEKQHASELEKMRAEVEADIAAFKEEVETAHNEQVYHKDDDEEAVKPKKSMSRKEVEEEEE